ncbi:hypothetical protein FDJ43_gp38 [Microbacterium phage Koji]|uniref:Uncharacterized protein n=1 Tax=Microbacterium phage Koji TaxID=2099625 RepID=A0A2P1CFB8_9CAUD|nr:hypothetical protein FDJ43_gp38 [Microbacterium phage Koji]AVJ49936.1 hypothetical protein PBI_KOJI_38 [Microbacterium phage Koji]
MATKNTAAVLDEELEGTEETPSHKATIEEAIQQVVETFGVSVKRSRLKGLRALAYFAFVNAINEGTLDDLVAQTIEGVDELPTGWTLERASRAEKAEKPAPAKKAPAKKPTAAKAPAKTAAKKAPAKAAPAKTARKRPTR